MHLQKLKHVHLQKLIVKIDGQNDGTKTLNFQRGTGISVKV